jgi:hypothetical protein
MAGAKGHSMKLINPVPPETAEILASAYRAWQADEITNEDYTRQKRRGC